ncbi:MAG: cell division protein ZapD [Legionellaceae bacterium]|nr:cell division protein ZapD [Legionellaceae bacterium]HAF87209.1 cell division protein ZapD [Legionellales bacterium]HCA89219.1 cell division protein ZapD [Legionellales bacterium]|tara:strand:+ start:703 stop:1440 length:738 start_codon:yes stop_codon:yes gene_type:complete
MTDSITFELATHYLSKITLRLKFLLNTIAESLNKDHAIIHRAALINLVEIGQLTEKPELKSRFLKELMRIEHLIQKKNLVISSSTELKLQNQIQKLTNCANFFNQAINTDPFLQAIRNYKLTSCQEPCPFELLSWLNWSEETRQNYLKNWLMTLETLSSTVDFYAILLSEQSIFHTIEVRQGFFHHPMQKIASCHLISLQIEKNIHVVPQMHLGHHGLSLRLIELPSMREIDIPLLSVRLAICQF